MQAATKIPTDHRVELKLPDDLPAGPAEVIVLASLPSAPTDRLAAEEARLDTEAYRDKLKLQKQGLMHDLLTGKVRVKP